MLVRPSRRARLVVSLVVSLTVATPAAAIDPSDRLQPRDPRAANPSTAGFVPGELIVRFTEGASEATRSRALAAVGTRLDRQLRARDTVLVRLPAAKDLRTIAALLERRPGVAYAEPNYVFRTFANPDDPRFKDLWGLNAASDHDIDAPEAWDVTTGSAEVLVAVVDSGVDASHPDLVANIWTNPGESEDGIDNDLNGLIDDIHGWDFVAGDNDPHDQNGHGTHVAGTIGASGNDGQGMTGVAWEVGLLPIRAGNAAGMLTNANVVDSFDYACEMGAHVINASFGGPRSLAVRDAIAACQDALFVVAAGNNANDNDANGVYPCSFTLANIVCVAATDRDDALAFFSNFGNTSVDLAAPGESILSATPNQVLFADGFEAGLGSWVKVNPSGIEWSTTPAVAQSGTRSATDSKDGLYANGSNTWIETAAPIDLSGGSDCELDYAIRFDTQLQADWVFVEGTDDGWQTWDFIDGDPSGDFAWTGSSQGAFLDVPNLLANDGFNSPGAFDFRFRLVSDGSVRRNGTNIDDVVVHCLTGSHGSDDYIRNSGTSMAAPHVAGAAALLLSAYPDTTVAELKGALIQGADNVSALSGRVVSDGRLNARGTLDELDTVPPVASPPSQRLAIGGSLGTDTIPLRVSWAAATDADPSSGVHRYQVWQRTKVGSTWRSWKRVGGSRTLSETVDVAPGIHQFRLRATDRAGNWSQYRLGTRFTLADPQRGGAIDFVRSWSTQVSTDFFDGSARWSGVLRASASHTFTGREVAWVGSLGPNRGRAKVYIDGSLAATVDLYAATRRHRRILFSTSWESEGAHTIKVKVVTPGNRSSGSRVDVDAFITLD